jgi:hypothetical protein
MLGKLALFGNFNVRRRPTDLSFVPAKAGAQVNWLCLVILMFAAIVPSYSLSGAKAAAQESRGKAQRRWPDPQ